MFPAAGSVLSVRELTATIKETLDGSYLLRDVTVRGEVSNLRDHPSGHLYFTLKDEAAAIRCVMFRGRRTTVDGAGTRDGAVTRDGEVAVARGYVSVYERDGQYQLYVQKLWRDEHLRLGELYRALEELKVRLQAEGLFDPARKRPLPALPRRVGIVTSPTAAALRDIIRVARRRYHNVHLVVVPAAVQGDRAPADLAGAIGRAGRAGGLDVLIVGRGGGSVEELWAFNSEEVARAIFASPIPVVSAVGHETDFTVADLVADVRAPTPSAAAEMVFPEKAALQRLLDDRRYRLVGAIGQGTIARRQRLERLSSRPVLARPLSGVLQQRQRLDGLAHRLTLAGRHRFEVVRTALGERQGRLELLNPQAVLGRGYSICLDADGHPLSAAAAVSAGDRVRVVLRSGSLDCEVRGISTEDGEE